MEFPSNNKPKIRKKKNKKLAEDITVNEKKPTNERREPTHLIDGLLGELLLIYIRSNIFLITQLYRAAGLV